MSISEQGIDPARYQVIPRTLIFLFDSLDRVLLIRGASNKKNWANLYNGIGGHIEAGEQILEAANRELIEETGIKGVNLDFCGQIMINVSSITGIALFIFHGHSNEREYYESSEGELRWIPVNDIEQFPVVEDLPLLLPKVFVCYKKTGFLIGKYTYDRNRDIVMSFV
jgi:8-oxo-dGTP diphosphatase